MHEEWLLVLDRIEAQADACERRYIHGEDIDLPTSPPQPKLGPLPSALEPRARRALERMRDVETKLARIPRPGVIPRRGRFGGTNGESSTVDRVM
jgi:hypothetical protein